MSGTTTRTYGIDLLRGVACVSVIAFHYLARGPLAGWMPELPLPLLEPFARYGFLGVHLFFMVSGFVIFMSAIGRTPREFVASRVSRLYPALWFAAPVTMLLMLWHANPVLTVSWQDFFWNLTLMPQYVGAQFVDGAYWSLAVELQFYIFVWLVLLCRLADRIELILWAWLGLSLIDAIRPMYPVERWMIANWAPLFVVGAGTFLGSSRGWTLARIAMLPCGAMLSFWHAHHELNGMVSEWGDRAPRISVVIAIIACSIAIFVAIGSGRLQISKSKLATIPGLLTYPVYLIHQFAGYAIYSELVRSGVTSGVALAAILIFSVVIGVVIHRYVERPFGPLLRGLIAPRRRSAVVAPS